MGGHAYSSYSGIPSLIGDYGVLTTGGGDNYVLAQQSTRYLIKVYQDACHNKTLSEFVNYFTNYKTLLEYECKNMHSILCPNSLISLFESLSVRMIKQLFEDIQNDLKSNKKLNVISNDRMVEIIECSRPHAIASFLKIFWQFIESVANNEDIQNTLISLFLILGLCNIEKQYTQLLRFKVLNIETIPFVRNHLLLLCKDIRKDLAHLVDAFDYTDWMLKSSLGKYDGDIYPAYFKDIIESGSIGKAPYWESEVLPLIKSKL